MNVEPNDETQVRSQPRSALYLSSFSSGARDHDVGRVPFFEHAEIAQRVEHARAAWAAFVPRGIEHEVVDDQLPAAGEKIDQADFASGSVEDVVFLDLDHRQFASRGVDFVVGLGLGLFAGEQRLARRAIVRATRSADAGRFP
ncbi:MAG: hypothetical protein QM811_03885 [Pirellulales bacterium]